MKVSNITHTILVVGSTGATGKHVVQMLLDRGDTKVVAVARSESRLKGLLRNGEEKSIQNLDVKEASIGQMSVDEIKDLTKGCSAVVRYGFQNRGLTRSSFGFSFCKNIFVTPSFVFCFVLEISCLGHNMNFKGMFRDGLFVSKAVKKLTKVMPTDCRFVMMGTDGYSYPDGSDVKRTLFERSVLSFLRLVLPPVKDNELAAEHLLDEAKSNKNCYEWVIARPGDLVNIVDDEVVIATSKKDYEIFEHTFGSLFGDNSTARSQVAHFMADLATMDSRALQKTYNHKMPVVYSRVDTTGTDVD